MPITLPLSYKCSVIVDVVDCGRVCGTSLMVITQYWCDSHFDELIFHLAF